MAARSLYLLQVAGVALAYAILAKIALSYFSANGAVTVVWPASGLALAALVIGGKKYLPGILIGAFFANSFNGDYFIEATTIAIGNTLAAFVSFSLLAHYNRLSKNLLELRDFLWLAFAGVIGSLVAAIIGVFAILQANVITSQQVATNLLHWWLGDTLGVILITPLVLVWQKLPEGWLNRSRIVETIGCFGLAFITGQIIFVGWLHELFPLARGFWMFIFVTWAALRFGRHGALLIISITASQVLIATVQDSGLFSNDFVEGGLLNAWFYILAISIVGITLSLVFERELNLRKAAEESIEDRLKLATESGQVAVWEVDLKTNKLTWDDTCFSLYKINKEGFNYTFEEWAKRIYPQDLQKTLEAFQNTVRGGAEYKPDFRIVWPDGEIRYIEGHGKVIHDEAGNPVRMIGTNWDITRLKEAEAQSRKNEERLKLAISSGHIGIWEFNLKTQRLLWDDNMFALYGAKKELFSSNYDEWTKLIHPEDLANTEMQRSDALSSIKEYESAFRIVRPDGEIRYIKERGDIVTNVAGEPISIIGTNWDNWAYTQSQHQLELAHTAINKSKTAFFWITPEGNVTDANEFACISLGYSQEALIGSSVWGFVPNFPQLDQQQVWNKIKKNEVTILESDLQREDGTSFPVEITANYLKVQGEERIFCSVQDISIRKKSEATLAQSEQRYKLLNEIGEKTRLLSDPQAIISLITTLLGSHLNVSRCAYTEVEEDGEHVVVLGNYVQGCPSMVGRHQLSLSGSYIVNAMRTGKTLVIDDIEKTIPAGEGLESFAAMNINATIGCPLIKDGKLQAIIGVQHISARQWTDEEVALTKEVAEHCWAIIERAKAEKERNKLSDIIDRSINEVLLLDVKTLNISYANQAARKNLGYTMQQLLSMSPADIKIDFDEVAFREMLTPLLEREVEQIIFEGIHRRHDNSTFPVEVQLQLADMADETQVLAFIQDTTERKRVKEELLTTQTAIDNSQTAFFKLNGEGVVTYVNDFACESLGYTKKELVGMHVTEFDPDFPAEAWGPMWKDLKKNKIAKIETRHQRKDGSTFPVEIVGNLITSEGKDYSFTFAQDITQRKSAEESLRLAASVFENSSEAMTVSDPEGIIITVNPAFTKITGFTPKEVIGKNRSMLSSGHHDEGFYLAMWEEINTTGHWQGEVLDRRKNGEVYPAWLTINTIFNEDNTPYRRISIFSDSTAWKETEALIWHQANFDPLTELPNRQMFHDRLQQDIKKARRGDESLALMFLDLDRFKEINDSLGHDMGDILLKEAATRIKNCVREADTVARLGGDEFTIILDDFDKDDGGLDRIAQDILNSITEPFQMEDEVGYVTASIGITLYPQDASDIDSLIKNADQAMYAAKSQGRNRYSYFTPSMQKKAQVRTRMANDLRSALKNNEFWLAYQPIIELSTGALFKAEALLRWQHPKLGLISPAHFIPVAEHTGLICEIGEWAFHESITQVKAWQNQYKKEFQISVNVSPVQIYDKSNKFKPWQAQLKKAKLDGKSIIVEITEGLLLEANTTTNEKLLEFRDAGIQVALDDFGTGYSSLSYLKKFDIDYIKIDQSFIRGLTNSTGDLALCEAMIVMAHKLDMKVIAEGVETNKQQALLKKIGCDFAQGYLISKPIPANEFELLLKT